MINLKKDEQRILVIEFKKAVLDYYSNNIFLSQLRLDHFVVSDLIENQTAELNQMINENKFTLLNVLRSIKNMLRPKYIVVRYGKNKYRGFYFKLRNILEKVIFEAYVKKQYEETIYLNKVKTIHLPILLKYKKKVRYSFVEESVYKYIKTLSLDNNNSSNYLKINEGYQNFDYINDQILSLDFLYDNNTLTNKNDVLKIIHNTKYKYFLALLEIDAINEVNQLSVMKNLKEILNNIERKDEFYLIVPIYNNYHQYLYWSVFIAQLNNSNIKTGIILNEYQLIYEIEKAPFTNLIIINYDEISKNNFNFSYFKVNIEQKLRFIKQIAKENDIKVVIKSNNLKEVAIIEKLIIMGFKMFVYNDNHYSYVEKSILNYMSRRGKYSTKRKK